MALQAATVCRISSIWRSSARLLAFSVDGANRRDLAGESEDAIEPQFQAKRRFVFARLDAIGDVAGKMRGYAQTNYAAKSWRAERGLDIRYVVANITTGSAEYIYDTLYCARGQMENLI